MIDGYPVTYTGQFLHRFLSNEVWGPEKFHENLRHTPSAFTQMGLAKASENRSKVEKLALVM